MQVDLVGIECEPFLIEDGVYVALNVAEGVVQAARGLRVPLVVRLAGTNVEEGRRIIKESGLPIIAAQSLLEAAQKAVEASKAHRARQAGNPR